MTIELALVGPALLITAAWRDVVIRSIPDTACLLLLITGAFARALEGPLAFVFSVGAALLLFALLLAAFSRGFIGGGDVKLMTALAVGLSPLGTCRFVIATTAAGGLLGFTYLLLSRWMPLANTSKRSSLFGRVFRVEAWRIRRRRPLPYGIAIAAGGVFVLLHSRSF